jgi:hypothetical protein
MLRKLVLLEEKAALLFLRNNFLRNHQISTSLPFCTAFLPAAINEVDGLRHWNDNSPPLPSDNL